MKKTSLRAMPETKLAKLQTLQIGNDCAVHSMAAAIELLTDVKLDLQETIDEVNRLWWRGRFYRLAPKSGITPPMQVRLLRFLAKKHHLPLKAKLVHLNPEVLRATAQAEDIASLVTIYWWYGNSPAIYYKDLPKNYNAVQAASGHTMLFAAYDPEHFSGTTRTPWGFINSWVNAGTGLFWMEDRQFRQAWAIPIPRWGNHATVIISLEQGKNSETL
ncbi:MAG: hypothetical protein M0P11_04300 [Anaerolineaceae bacterium]|jgi:hypothetical protein|nr:hypothetical protein [Anaerolineaceae bacterium]